MQRPSLTPRPSSNRPSSSQTRMQERRGDAERHRQAGSPGDLQRRADCEDAARDAEVGSRCAPRRVEGGRQTQASVYSQARTSATEVSNGRRPLLHRRNGPRGPGKSLVHMRRLGGATFTTWTRRPYGSSRPNGVHGSPGKCWSSRSTGSNWSTRSSRVSRGDGSDRTHGSPGAQGPKGDTGLQGQLGPRVRRVLRVHRGYWHNWSDRSSVSRAPGQGVSTGK
jgi:hypothetical protein